MVPFMYQDLKALIKNLLKSKANKGFKASVIEKCNSGAQMAELDLSDSSILLDAKNIENGFAVEEIVQKLIRKDLVTNSQLTKFWEDSRALAVSILSSLFQKLPNIFLICPICDHL